MYTHAREHEVCIHTSYGGTMSIYCTGLRIPQPPCCPYVMYKTAYTTAPMLSLCHAQDCVYHSPHVVLMSCTGLRIPQPPCCPYVMYRTAYTTAPMLSLCHVQDCAYHNPHVVHNVHSTCSHSAN